MGIQYFIGFLFILNSPDGFDYSGSNFHDVACIFCIEPASGRFICLFS